jgi:hypothetical protein
MGHHDDTKIWLQQLALYDKNNLVNKKIEHIKEFEIFVELFHSNDR